MTPVVEQPVASPEAVTPVRPWHRWFVAAGAVLAAFLLGATAGLLVGLPGGPTVPAADSVDVGFAQDMSVHHDQAVEMAGWERDHTTDPRLHTLAFDIESTQTAEIGRMQGWLTLWGAPQQALGGHMRWMAGMPAGHHGGAAAPAGVAVMPGMASPEELARLRAASGPAADVLFLQLMLRHHEGGAGMLDYAAQHAGVPVVRDLAAQMAAAQAAESDYLRTLLAERGAAPLPAP